MLHSWWLRIRKRRQLDRDLRDELAHHLEMRPDARKFGNVTLIQEELRETWSFVWLENIWRDLRHSVRILSRAPGHTVAIVLLLALGIGVNAAIFSLFDAVLIRKLAVERPDELVLVEHLVKGDATGWSIPRFENFRSAQTSLSGMFAMGEVGPATSLDPAGTEMLGDQPATLVSGNFFQLLGVRPLLGRVFSENDDRREEPGAVIVLSHRYWVRYFGGNPGVIGRQVYLGRNPFTVIGVTPEAFVGLGESFWAPLNAMPLVIPGLNLLRNEKTDWTHVFGRLKPGVTLQQAQAESDVVYSPLPGAAGGAPDTVRLQPGNRGFELTRLEYGNPLRILMAAVGLLLLITCANVGSLLLARAGSRQREIAVRLALGCGRQRLIRQFLIESFLLAGAGCVVGLLIASWSARSLVALASQGAPLPIHVALDERVFAFALGVAAIAAILFGLAPALRASAVAIEPALRSGSRTATGSHSRQLLNRCLVAGQVALSVVLVAGSALFGQSLYRLLASAGFDGRNVLNVTMNVSMPRSSEEYLTLARTLTDRLTSLPGVKAAGIASCGIMGPCRSMRDVVIEGAARRMRVSPVTANLLDMFGIPVLAGRGLRDEDRAGGQRVAVINETFARTYFSGQNVIGRQFSLADDAAHPFNIVGVVRNARNNLLREPEEPVAFVPFAQFPGVFFSVQLKVDRPSTDLFATVRRTILEVNPRLRPDRMEMVDEVLNRSASRDILLARLTALFGALALGLACFGVYGVVSYLVVSKTNEIGIRLAVGAKPENVLRQTIVDALKTVAPGVALGIGIAVGAERFIAAQLFGVRMHDPVMYSAVAACLMLTTSLAAYLPARRASRIDPLTALRCD